MKHLAIKMLTVLAITAALCATAFAQTKPAPPCITGTANAVNPEKQLAKGEWEFTAPAGAIVKMEYRESPTSAKIREVRCTLTEDLLSVAPAPGTPGKPWAKVCGNGFWPDGWTIPLPAGFWASLTGKPGDRGPKGDTGPRGPKGDPGKDLVAKGNWYTNAWNEHPVWTGFVHAVLAGVVDCGLKLAPCGGGSHHQGPSVGTDPATKP